MKFQFDGEIIAVPVGADAHIGPRSTMHFKRADVPQSAPTRVFVKPGFDNEKRLLPGWAAAFALY